MPEGIETEVFLVMVNRADETFPGIEKTVDMELHDDKTMANFALREITELHGPHYGIYKAVVKVVEWLVCFSHKKDYRTLFLYN